MTTSRLSRRAGAWLAVSLALGLTGCESRVSLGASCRRTSDCSGAFTCALDRCRAGCGDHAACGPTERCLRISSTAGVCTLIDDPACDTTSCGDGRVCRDGDCFDACDATCGLGGTCVGGLCVRTETDAGTPSDAAPSDAGASDATVAPDASPAASRRACALDAHCTGSDRCTRVHVRDQASCRRPCANDGDCDQSSGTSRCVQMGAVDGSGLVPVCAIPCDPVASTGCLGTDACDILGLPDPAGAMGIEVLECRERGAGGLGTSCESQIGFECDATFSCVIEDAAYVCIPVCAEGPDGATPCPSSRSCVPSSPTLQRGDVAYGRCRP